ncbi:MAG: flagellin [Acidobacteria bacterium]|nr:flagellin [Acidobacteriota bacterium]
MPNKPLSGIQSEPKEFTEEFIVGNFSILNNIAALYAQKQLGCTNVSLTQTINRLSSGRRINSGADDAAGLMIADTLRANIRALDQAVRNANDCISVGQIADGALQEITNLLTRSVTLAEEAATETVDSTGRACLDAEFDQIESEIARIGSQTNFNGVKLFTTDGLNGSLSVFVGDIFGSSSIAVTIDTITTAGETVTDIGGEDLTLVDLSTQEGAQLSLGYIRDALIAVANQRATIGAGANRLQSAVQVMQSQALNTQSAESTIRDANMATEISNLTKFQILNQAGMAALSQANGQSSSILALMQSM